MRKPCHLAILTVLLGLAASTDAAVITSLFNTGVNGSGAVLANGTTPDPHYSLVSVPSGSSTTLVLTSAGGWPIPPWLGNDTLSAWIRPNNGGTTGNDNDPVGTYVFRTTFDLTGLSAGTASILGKWSTDNVGLKIVLNGVDTGNAATAANQFQIGYKNFSISSGFVSGLNTLDFYVENGTGGTGNPVGLRVEMGGTALVPEPTAVMAGTLLLLPFGVSTIRRLRKSK